MSERKQTPKMLLTGPRSRLGSRLLEAAQKKGWVTVGLDRIQTEGFLTADITDRKKVFEAIRNETPDVVVHTAAFTNVDACEREKDAAWNINVLGTENVALACQEVGTRLIHVSTDFVFDGQAGPYCEDDQPLPINVYGHTKWESEKKVKEICPEALTVRICAPYDWNTVAAPNFIMWLVQQLRLKSKVRIFTDQWNTPAYLPQVSQTILDCFEKKLSGILHLSGKEFISRYDFALKVCRIFQMDEALISPCTSTEFKQVARRPLKAGLKVERIEKLLGIPMLRADEGIRLTFEQAHP